MLRVVALAALFSSFCAVGLAADPSPVPLDVAVKTGLVEVEVKGRGACTGDAVRVEVRRKVDRAVQVVVEPGTVMESASGDAQNMVCSGVKYQKEGDAYRRVDVMVLNDDRPLSFLVEAFCRDFAKPTPGAGCAFRLGSKDQQALGVIDKGKAAGASLRAIQVAVWLQAGVSEDDLRRRFKATDVEVKTANGLVEATVVAQRGDSDAEKAVDAKVQVLVKDLFAELRNRRKEIDFVHGDTVVVTEDGTPIRFGRRTIATARKGETFVVTFVGPDGVRVKVPSGKDKSHRQLGVIALDRIKLAEGTPRGEGRPALRALGELVSETDLEVITASERGE